MYKGVGVRGELYWSADGLAHDLHRVLERLDAERQTVDDFVL